MNKGNSGEINNLDWKWVSSPDSEPTNFYGLKVRLKDAGEKILIDVESSISSDNHYLQYGLNCYASLISKMTLNYYIKPYQLFGILATAAEMKVTPTTSDAGFLTDGWWINFIWLGYGMSEFDRILSNFKSKYPQCKEIALVSSDSAVSVKVTDDGMIKDFDILNLNVNESVISLGDCSSQLDDQV